MGMILIKHQLHVKSINHRANQSPRCQVEQILQIPSQQVGKLRLDNQNDEDDSPDHTDTDRYGDLTGSQADVEQEPDAEQVVVIDSPDEAQGEGGAMVNPEPASTSQETPPETTTEVASGVSQETPSTAEAVPDVSQETPPATTTEVASGVSQETPPSATEATSGAMQETTSMEESTPKASAPPRPMGKIDAFTSSKGDYFNPLKNPIRSLSATTPEKKQAPGDSQKSQTTETQSQETTNEGATPPATTSEAAPSQPAEGEASNYKLVGGGPASASASAATSAETAASSAQGAKAKSAALPPSVPNSLVQTLSIRRKPISQPPQETAEEKEKREENERIAKDAAEKNAAELIDQEQRKIKLSEREAKSKQAAASNTERAREAAEKARKAKEDAKSADQPSRTVLRRMKKVPDQDDEDPPDKDQTPWKIYAYKPPPKARGVYSYDGHAITNKMTAIDPQHVVNMKATVFGRGTNLKPIDAVSFCRKDQLMQAQNIE